MEAKSRMAIAALEVYANTGRYQRSVQLWEEFWRPSSLPERSFAARYMLLALGGGWGEDRSKSSALLVIIITRTFTPSLVRCSCHTHTPAEIDRYGQPFLGKAICI